MGMRMNGILLECRQRAFRGVNRRSEEGKAEKRGEGIFSVKGIKGLWVRDLFDIGDGRGRRVDSDTQLRYSSWVNAH